MSNCARSSTAALLIAVFLFAFPAWAGPAAAISVEPIPRTDAEPLQPPSSAHPLQGRVIGIDPGHQRHGNYKKERIAPNSRKTRYKVSAGTTGVATKVPEYVQTLRIALMLKAQLEACGATVVMTRESHDVNISNMQRALLCNAAGCDLVLRLHCNAAARSVSGIAILYSPVGPAGGLSRLAAETMLPKLKASLRPKRTWLTRTRAFTGCNWSTVPCLLIEMGFMSNPQEDRKMNDPDYQAQLCAAMVDGAEAFMLAQNLTRIDTEPVACAP